jgi:hypothetical protein
MPWARMDDKSNGNAKLLALSDPAWRLYWTGNVYVRANHTNGFIPEHAIATFGVRARGAALRRAIEELCSVLVPGKAPLWHREAAGFQVHDYLDWNDAADVVQAAQREQKLRSALFRDPVLREEIRRRDGDVCRYCTAPVRWTDKKGDRGGTYDHVDPRAGSSLDNIVVCCRACAKRKAGRSLEVAGMVLQPVLDLFLTRIGFRSGFESDCAPSSSTSSTDQNQKEQRRQRVAPRMPDEAPHVLARLAHCVLDDVASGHVDERDVSSELKERAAKARIQYDAERIRKALDSAEYQRRRQA